MIVLVLLLIVSQVFLFVKYSELLKVKKESEEVIEKYKDVKIVANIPEEPQYEDIEPDYKTFYNFMENIKLENWKVKIDDDYCTDTYSYWTVLIESHDGEYCMYISLNCYDGKQVEFSTCRIGRTQLGVGNTEHHLYIKSTTKHQIKTDITIFAWDYIIKYYEDKNQKIFDKIKDNIDVINKNMKTLNRSNRLDDILKF